MNKERIGVKNFFEVFSEWRRITLFLVLFSLMNWLFIYFTDLQLIAGNYGQTYLWIHLFLQVSISFLFATFVVGTLFKFLEFSKFSVKETSVSTIASFFAVIAAGCLSCSVTLATYIGLAGVLSLLPWGGLELKVIGLLLLAYSNYSLFKSLHTCKLRAMHKKKKDDRVS